MYGATSVEAALEQLDQAVGDALREAGCEPRAVDASSFCLAGADWPEDLELLRQALRVRGFERRLTIYNDAFGALRAGSEDFTGVATVCGTGGATGARSASGAIWHAGWWQDVQGARQLGQRALWAVIHAELGMAPATGMTEGILAAYGADAMSELIHRMTRRDGGRWAPEAAAPVLVREADAGDRVARSIVEAHGRALADYALAAWRRVSREPLRRAVLAGTVLRQSSVMARAASEHVLAGQPGARVVMPDLEPVAGAVLLAMDSAGIRADETTRARLTLSPIRG